MATKSTSVRGDGANGEGGSTIIGESVQIKGTLSGDEDLHVFGRIDGRIELQRTLIVAPSGIVKADVSVSHAIISGVVVGNVQASESIEITKEGRMVGDVAAPRVIIVDGASFRGNVDMGDVASASARKPASERSRPTPAARPVQAAAPKAKPVITAAKSIAPAPASVSRIPERVPERTTMPPRPATMAPMEAPLAKGLPEKLNKTRVIVKRK